MLMICGGTGEWGCQRADILTVVFSGTRLGNAMPLTCLFGGI